MVKPLARRAPECIKLVDPDDPGLVLSDLPNSVLDTILGYAQRFKPNRMVSNYGVLPAADQVDAARSWIEDLQTLKAGGNTAAEAD